MKLNLKCLHFILLNKFELNSLFHYNNLFAGSPFKFHVDSISSGYVTAYGQGLTHGVSGEPSNFTISTKGAGAGNFK